MAVTTVNSHVQRELGRYILDGLYGPLEGKSRSELIRGGSSLRSPKRELRLAYERILASCSPMEPMKGDQVDFYSEPVAGDVFISMKAWARRQRKNDGEGNGEHDRSR